ncbi:acyl CoA binding protein-domain-containing protein [Syncephalis plumigaleata]|nr:acyl CoA binding protein-domain-containing protein [Syncephalis plumigaleata]
MTSIGASDQYTSLDRQFNLACRIVRECQRPARLSGESKDGKLPRLSLAESNSFYGLFKQGTKGDCSRSRPGRWDPLGRGKWESWKSLMGVSSVEAKQRYVDSVMMYLQKHINHPRATELLVQIKSFDTNASSDSSRPPPSQQEDIANVGTYNTINDVDISEHALHDGTDDSSPLESEEHLPTNDDTQLPYESSIISSTSTRTDNNVRDVESIDENVKNTLTALQERLEHVRQAEETLEKLQTELTAIQERIEQHKRESETRSRADRARGTGPRSWLRALLRHAFVHSTLLVFSLVVYRLTVARQRGYPGSTLVSSVANINAQQVASMDIESAVGRPAWPISILVRWIDSWLSQMSSLIRRLFRLR